MWIYAAWSDGFAVSKLWAWHAVPLGFRPVQTNTFAAIMVALTIMFARYRNKDTASKRDKAMKGLMLLLLPWAGLAVGWWLR
jgi:hypothetical protein